MVDNNTTSSINELLAKIDIHRLPRHIAIIMDGNGRWAKQRLRPRISGHQRGVKMTREIVRCCRELGVEVLSLYAFSEENWSRPALEIGSLMKLLEAFVISERKELMDNDIRLRTIGNMQKLHAGARKQLEKTLKMTANNRAMTLNLALSYSGRDEIIRAVRDAIDRGLKSEAITQDSFAELLDTREFPDPDLLIRTSGELRISNFMLWQLAYTEIFITDTLWPDFSRQHLLQAVLDFQQRKRRFGGIEDVHGPTPTQAPHQPNIKERSL